MLAGIQRAVDREIRILLGEVILSLADWDVRQRVGKTLCPFRREGRQRRPRRELRGKHSSLSLLVIWTDLSKPTSYFSDDNMPASWEYLPAL